MQLDEEIKDIYKSDDHTRKVNNDIKLIQTYFNKEVENISKEITIYQEKIRGLEIDQRDFNNVQETLKFELEYELSKANNELKYSEERLTLSLLSYESLKRDIENKKKQLVLFDRPVENTNVRGTRLLRRGTTGKTLGSLVIDEKQQAELVSKLYFLILGELKKMETKKKLENKKKNKSPRPKSSKPKKPKADKENKNVLSLDKIEEMKDKENKEKENKDEKKVKSTSKPPKKYVLKKPNI